MHTVNGVPYILYFYTYTIHEIRPPISKSTPPLDYSWLSRLGMCFLTGLQLHNKATSLHSL